MKFLRNIAYGLIVLCAVGCIVILTYNGKKNDTENNTSTVAVDNGDSTSIDVVISDGEIGIDDVLSAASVIISEAKEDVIDVVASISASAGENTTGEISYAEIVRLQEEEVALQMAADVSASNYANGIVTSTSTSTSTSASASASKDYNYVVNKTTKKIHRMGCLLEPKGSNASYYEKLSEAILAGYTDKCSVCSP